MQGFHQDGNAQVEKTPNPTTLKMQGKHLCFTWHFKYR
jgi:hypothetical protein